MKVLLILTVCAVSVHGKVAPDYFPQCKRSDPEIEKCVRDGIENMREHLKTGIPEVQVPALEPLTIPTLKLDRTSPQLRLKAVLKNMKAYGGGNFKIEKLRLHLNNKYGADVKITIPKLGVTADYDVRGSRLLTLDISGKGKLRGNFNSYKKAMDYIKIQNKISEQQESKIDGTGITAVAKGIGKPILKDGVEYLQAEKIVLKLRINHGQVHFDDTQRPVAASSAAAFFNASPRVVLDVLNPLIEDTGTAVVKAFINKVLGSVPIKEILLDDEPTAA